jgi:hypothetical protein
MEKQKAASVQAHGNGAGAAGGNGQGAQEVLLPPVNGGFELAALQQRREKLVNGLNSLRVQHENLMAQAMELESNIRRTEGALVMLNALIEELSPSQNAALASAAPANGQKEA